MWDQIWDRCRFKSRTVPEKILVFQLNWLGDILFSYPFLRALAKAFPEAEITCAVVSGYAELLTGNPWVRSVIKLPEKRGAGSAIRIARLIPVLRKEKFDMCFLLKPSRTKSIIAASAGIKERIGFSGKKDLLTTAVELPSGKAHRADQILALAAALGITKADGTYEYFLTPGDEDRAEKLLMSAGSTLRKRVALNPGGNWAPKRWPEDKFEDLARKLLDKFKDVEIVITGAKKDRKMAEGMVSKINSKRCYSVAGRTGINIIAAIFKKCALVVSADSGPLHLASATGVPTIGLFGPTSPEITGQRGRGMNMVIHKPSSCTIPCYVENCEKGHECMLRITPEDVLGFAGKVLSK
ncbi:MAG: lipopolysaccharide heptosyltransferase II [Candidatus Omnitrophota bacterium]